MQIRPFHSSDFPAILEIYALSKLDELQFEERVFTLVPLDQDPPRLARFRESDAYVCEMDGVVGFAASLGSSIRFLFVHPQARGRGVGKCLLEFMLDRMPGTVSLNVAKSNSLAKRLYAQYGFQVVGEFQATYSGVDVLANTMQRDGSIQAF